VLGVVGAGAGRWAGGAGSVRGGAMPVVAGGDVVVVVSVATSVEFIRPKMNTSTSASTTAPAIQPHIAFELSSSLERIGRGGGSCNGG
jgi:hypothetical protein